MFAAELLNGTGNPLVDLLERDQVAEVIAGRRQLDAYGKTALWATLAAAVWLDRGELPLRYQRNRPPVAVAVPKVDRAVLIIDTTHFDIDVDEELRRLCDDLLTRCEASQFDHPPNWRYEWLRSATPTCATVPGIWSPNGAVSSATPGWLLTAPFWHRVAARVGLVLVIGQSDAPRASAATAVQVAAIRAEYLAGDSPRRSSRRHRGGVGGTAPGRFSWRSSPGGARSSGGRRVRRPGCGRRQSDNSGSPRVERPALRHRISAGSNS